jgi:hypothetical protein
MTTAWWNVLKLRREVTAGAGSIDDVQMSLFRAVHGVAGERAVYADPTYYGEITHPSPNLVDLMGKVIVRLGGGPKHTAAPALWQLDQAMGGGKSHGLIGLWQVAANPVKMRFTDVGKEAFELAGRIVGAPIVDDLGKAQVVVLACDNMTAGKRNEELDGPGHTLHERFLWRLFGGDFTLYKRYKDHYADKSKLAEALVAVHRPILILVDEILDYVRQLSASEHKDLAVRDMAFLRALLDTVNDAPNVAMVVVMISSERDPMHLDAEAQGRRAELEALLVRNGKPATVTSHTDFAAILRRRLFDTPPAKEVVHSTVAAFNDAMKGAWGEKVFLSLSKGNTDSFEDEALRCYPFHPSLLALAEQEWSQLAGFQKVRSTIRIFAAAVFIQWQRAKRGEWAPLLIGPGDLPLSASEVREAVIGSGMLGDIRTQANYRQIAATDIVSEDDKGGSARLLDLNRGATLFTTANPRAAERAATALFLLSVGARPQGRRGATEAELKAACFVPHSAFSLPDAESVLHELQDSATGLAALERIEGRGGQSARLFLSTRQTVNMLFRAAREAIGDAERDAELAKLAETLSNSGPFRDKKFVEAKSEDVDARSLKEILAIAGIDDARSTRLVVLDPRRFALQDGTDKDLREALRAAFGIGPEKLAVQWASSAVFAIINTQRRRNARGAITNYLAWSRVCRIDAVRTDDELLQKAKDEVEEARGSMNTLVKRAFQFVAYLDQGSEADGEGRIERLHRFEQDNQSALDGTIVWKTLAGMGKTFDKDQFTAKALMHNLTDNDFGRPLNELRDLFWSAPRLPLLPSGDADLQSAIFGAVQEGALRLIGDDDTDRAVTRPADIAVGSSSLKLARPQVTETATQPTAGVDESTGGVGVGGGTSKARGADGRRRAPDTGSGPTTPPTTEVQVGFSVNVSLSDAEKRQAMWELMYALADRVDNDASHLQVTVKIVMPDGERLEELKRLASTAGVVPSVTDLS